MIGVQRFPSTTSSVSNTIVNTDQSYVNRLRRAKATAWCERGQQEEVSWDGRGKSMERRRFGKKPTRRAGNNGYAPPSNYGRTPSMYSQETQWTSSIIPARHPHNLPPRLSATEAIDDFDSEFRGFEQSDGEDEVEELKPQEEGEGPEVIKEKNLVELSRRASVGSAVAINAASVPIFSSRNDLPNLMEADSEDDDQGKLVNMGRLTIANPDISDSE